MTTIVKKVKLNRKGVRALLKSEAMQNICYNYAAQVQQRSGPGYEVQKRQYPERNGAAVVPATYEAYRDNLENNTLEKAVRSL